MKKIDVMFYEVFEEEKVFLKKYLSARVKAAFTSNTVQENKDKRCPAPVICIRTQSRIPLSWINNVQSVLTRSQGYDHLVSLSQKNIPCGYLIDYSSRAVAEHSILSMFVLLRKLKTQIRHFENFNRDQLTGRECLGKNVLVVGVGCIGREIVDIVRGLKMNVYGVDVDQRLKNLEYVSLREGMKWADIVFCAASLTNQTKGMFNHALFKKGKKGIIFVNIARGEISPIKDLKQCLDLKILSGVSLDVYEHEDCLANCLRQAVKKAGALQKTIMELKRRDNVLFTPHNAFNTIESVERKSKQTVEAINHFLKQKTFPNIISLKRLKKN